MSKGTIHRFEGRFAFLNNFHACEVEYHGQLYPSVEHAFQAAKACNEFDRARILAARTPGEAKRLGNRIKLRSDWEEKKIRIMHALVRSKFTNSTLRAMLIATGEAKLVEGNHWGDSFWGVCNGVGKNHLGKILMKVRREVQR